METTNRKTGYSSFSGLILKLNLSLNSVLKWFSIGYKLGCNYDDMPTDFTEAAIEDVDQTLGKSQNNNNLFT